VARTRKPAREEWYGHPLLVGLATAVVSVLLSVFLTWLLFERPTRQTTERIAARQETQAERQAKQTEIQTRALAMFDATRDGIRAAETVVAGKKAEGSDVTSDEAALATARVLLHQARLKIADAQYAFAVRILTGILTDQLEQTCPATVMGCASILRFGQP
jgi:hypothetical protein